MKDPGVIVSVRSDEMKSLRDRSLRGFAALLDIERKEIKGIRDQLRLALSAINARPRLCSGAQPRQAKFCAMLKK
jgi:hypothetical protein